MVKDARSTVVPKETANKKILILSAAKNNNANILEQSN